MNKGILIVAIAFSGCSDKQPHVEQAGKEEALNALYYQYEPVVSTLTGTLTTQLFWGPPGYGEDTIADERELECILVLDKAIHIQKPDSDISGGYDGLVNAIDTIQVVHQQKVNNYFHKKVKVTGTLFGAQTGHHHTEILIDLITIK